MHIMKLYVNNTSDFKPGECCRRFFTLCLRFLHELFDCEWFLVGHSTELCGCDSVEYSLYTTLKCLLCTCWQMLQFTYHTENIVQICNETEHTPLKILHCCLFILSVNEHPQAKHLPIRSGNNRLRLSNITTPTNEHSDLKEVPICLLNVKITLQQTNEQKKQKQVSCCYMSQCWLMSSWENVVPDSALCQLVVYRVSRVTSEMDERYSRHDRSHLTCSVVYIRTTTQQHNKL